MKNRELIFYVLLALFSLFLACLSTNYDWDLFARLIVGENFVESGILPYKDFLSYTPTHSWYDHEWGSGVIFYLFLKYLGAFGLLFLQAILIFLTSVFVIKTTKLSKHSYPISTLYVITFATLLFILSPHIVRCQMFTFFFFSMFLYILEKNRHKSTNLIWTIPLLTIIWNNLHGGVVSGLGLILIYIVSSLLEKKIPKSLIITLIISSIFLIINPYGINYLGFLFSATTMERKYIVEWCPVFAPIHFKHYLIPVLAILSCLLLSLKKYKLNRTIVLSVVTLIGLLHAKLLPLALISSAALCYNDVIVFTKPIKNILKRIEKSFFTAIFISVLTIPMFTPTYARGDFSLFPLYEIEFLKINNIKGNLVLPFGQGSYASYKLYPNNLIFMDGRYEEVYNNKEFLALRDFELAEDNWSEITTNYPTDILMPPKSSEIYPVLLSSTEWSLIFEGYRCGIFIRQKDLKQNYVMPEKSIEYYRKTMFEHEKLKK